MIATKLEWRSTGIDRSFMSQFSAPPRKLPNSKCESGLMREIRSHLEIVGRMDNLAESRNRIFQSMVNKTRVEAYNLTSKSVRKSKSKTDLQGNRLLPAHSKLQGELNFFKGIRTRCLQNETLRKQIKTLLRDQPEVYQAILRGSLAEMRLTKYELFDLVRRIEGVQAWLSKCTVERVFRNIENSREAIRGFGAGRQAALSLNPGMSAGVSKLISKNREMVQEHLGEVSQELATRFTLDEHIQEYYRPL